jgi:hypothetical protein
MKIRIEIEYSSFNNEYIADITLTHNRIIHIGSDDIRGLLDTIEHLILKHDSEMKAK